MDAHDIWALPGSPPSAFAPQTIHGLDFGNLSVPLGSSSRDCVSETVEQHCGSVTIGHALSSELQVPERARINDLRRFCWCS